MEIIFLYLHEVQMKISEKEFIAKVGFSDCLGIGFNIIVRKDVFENLIFCFDDYAKELRTIAKSNPINLKT